MKKDKEDIIVGRTHYIGSAQDKFLEKNHKQYNISKSKQVRFLVKKMENEPRLLDEMVMEYKVK